MFLSAFVESIVSKQLAIQKWISLGLFNYEESYFVYPRKDNCPQSL